MKLETLIKNELADLFAGGKTCEIIAHTLQHDGEGWSTNDSWFMERDADLETLLSRVRGRFEVFKVNYMPRARVKDLKIEGEAEYSLYLNVACVPFMELRFNKD